MATIAGNFTKKLLDYRSVSQPEEFQSHSGPLGTTEKHLTADMNQQLSIHSCASNDVQPEAVVLHKFENDLS